MTQTILGVFTLKVIKACRRPGADYGAVLRLNHPHRYEGPIRH